LKDFKIVSSYFSVLLCDSFPDISMGDRIDFRVIIGILWVVLYFLLLS